MKALLVSDNKDDWETIRNILKANYPKIELVCSINSSDAITVAGTDGPFGFFMLDCNMKEEDPNELGLSLVDFTGPRPIIFLGNEAMINDRISQELFATNEFNEKIHKPLDREDFLEEFKAKVNRSLSWAKEEEFEQSLEKVNPDDFIKMKLKAFYLYKTFPYDIFLAITSSTYIKIISADKPYTHSLLVTYAKKNIKFLHIKKDDQLKYLEGESLKCLKALRSISPTSGDIYLLQIRSMTVLHQYLIALGVTPTVLTLGNALADSVNTVFDEKTDLIQILAEYPYFYEGTASKSLLTAYICAAVAKKLSWESETVKKKLTICSILQDVSLPDEAMSKINSENSSMLQNYSEEEQELFFNHPLTAAEYAKQFTSYPDIDYIVESHHELPNRKGFPTKPTSSKLTKVCAVFNVSQFIAAEIDGAEPSNAILSKAVKTMSRDFSNGNFREVLNIIKSIFKIK